jgi:hypothetical protein
VLLAAVCKSPGHAWNDADITELLSFRHKSLPAGNLNAKHPFWNSAISNTSGAKLLNLLHVNEIEISGPQCPTHYSPAGNGDVLDIFVHENVRLSEIIVSDIMESDHLPIVLHLLDHIRTKNLSNPVDKFTDFERFESIACELISPMIQIISGEKADKAVRDFIAFISSAYRLSLSKISLSHLNKGLSGLESLTCAEVKETVAINPGFSK